MKILINFSVAAFLAVFMSGCIVVGDRDHWHDDNDWRAHQKENREIISTFDIGTSRSQVLTQLGAPDFSEAFQHSDDDYRVLFYRTQHRHSDGDTTIDETTPLVFKNDRLIGWGEDSLIKVRNL